MRCHWVRKRPKFARLAKAESVQARTPSANLNFAWVIRQT